MKFTEIVNRYVAFKQSMGMCFDTEARILKYFSRKIGDRDITEVDPSSVLGYIAGTGPVTSFWHRKFAVLNGFYHFATSRGYAISSPLPKTVPKHPPPLVPYIYTTAELRRLLEAAETLKNQRRLPGATLRILLLTLYGAALRISEALLLTRGDVDLNASLLTIRDSKFYKTRLVPIGPRLTAELHAYAQKRRRLPCPEGTKSTFFATRVGTPIKRSCIEWNFRRLCTFAGIRRCDGGRFQPRIHDIRHAAAVHRIVAWYRQGADVQRLLPHLSTYLGHVGIAGTQRYLTMTPELLQEANCRFERYALSEVNYVQ